MQVVFDIGGSKMRVAEVVDGKLSNIRVKETPADYESGLKILGQLIGKPEKAAGGIAGQWNKEKTKILKSPNLPGWENMNIKSDLESLCGCEVILENDAALGGLGEAVYGAGKDHSIVAYLTFGTGVGGARIVDKKIDVNFSGFEPGRMIVMSPKTLEDVAGGKHNHDLENVAVWAETAVINVRAMWSPEIVVVGGGMGSLVKLPKESDVRRSVLGDEAGMYGAMCML